MYSINEQRKGKLIQKETGKGPKLKNDTFGQRLPIKLVLKAMRSANPLRDGLLASLVSF